MDEKIARLRTAADARKLAENAKRLGNAELAREAFDRSLVLKAIEEGHTSPAQQEIAVALYAYEARRSELEGRRFWAGRTRQMLKNHGYLAAAERMVLRRRPSSGFEVLDEAGLQELSFESIIDRFPEEFSPEAVEAARARLNGLPPPARASRRQGQSNDPVTKPVFAADAEFMRFIEGFLQPDAWFRSVWLPGYRESVAAIADGLNGNSDIDLVEILWKRQDNLVSNAGLGLLRHELVDSLHADFLGLTTEIAHDGRPESFDALESRLEAWRSEGRIPNVPRLLLARAFAAIHPELYHTTVDVESHNSVLKWFAEHAGFRIPRSSSWAVRAHALCEHLDSSGLLGNDPLVRNIFPWFVTDHLRVRSAAGIRPGHNPRSAMALSHLTPEVRAIRLRHNELQTVLYHRLVQEFGKERVWTEYPTGMGCYADAIARDGREQCHLYEIKIAASASDVVRQAMGQLLEYGFHSGGLEPIALFAVGEPELDPATGAFLERLRTQFGLNISYLQLVVPPAEAELS